jgi:ribonuclease HI
VAGQLAFDELPDGEELMERWRGAYSRWKRLQQTSLSASSSVSLSAPTDTDDDGSAYRHVFCAAQSRSDGAPSGASSLSFSPTETVKLYTDGSCDRLGRGGWATIFVAPSLPEPMRGYDRIRRTTTNNRAELIAVIKGMERLAAPTRVQIVSDSKYVVRGIRDWLANWKAQGWRAGSGRNKRALKNADLWQKLDALMSPHKVTCKWVRGHAGNAYNEECDRMAGAAAKR